MKIPVKKILFGGYVRHDKFPRNQVNDFLDIEEDQYIPKRKKKHCKFTKASHEFILTSKEESKWWNGMVWCYYECKHCGKQKSKMEKIILS